MIFAAYFILRGLDTHINFLRLLFLPSDARALSLTSFSSVAGMAFCLVASTRATLVICSVLLFVKL